MASWQTAQVKERGDDLIREAKQSGPQTRNRIGALSTLRPGGVAAHRDASLRRGFFSKQAGNLKPLQLAYSQRTPIKSIR
jgi:hypothetical protein